MLSQATQPLVWRQIHRINIGMHLLFKIEVCECIQTKKNKFELNPGNVERKWHSSLSIHSFAIRTTVRIQPATMKELISTTWIILPKDQSLDKKERPSSCGEMDLNITSTSYDQFRGPCCPRTPQRSCQADHSSQCPSPSQRTRCRVQVKHRERTVCQHFRCQMNCSKLLSDKNKESVRKSVKI
jgi:hypothetical protein